jgi:hypothetical protein
MRDFHGDKESYWRYQIGLIPPMFLLISMEIPHYIGFGGLTTMERITHQIH